MNEKLVQGMLNRLDAIEARLSKLEGKTVTETVPPPVMSQAWVGTSDYTIPPIKMDDKTEYFIGAKVLPRAGAAVLVLMFAYFVSLAYDRGWIGPATIFAGAVMLCLVLIGIGQWKREEREQFGEILTAIGSCGMFLDFAGGHLYQKLYSGETMVLLFVIWSLLNQAYGLWRSSRAFLAIGCAGGFTAAMMPLDQQRPDLAMQLFVLIFVPACLVALRHRWTEAVIALWAGATAVASVIAFHHGLDWRLGIAMIEGTAVVSAAGLALIAKEDEPHPLFHLAFLEVVLSALAAFALKSEAVGAVHLSFFAASIAVCGLWPRVAEPARKALLAGSATVVCAIAPFGLNAQASVAVFLVAAVLAAVLSGRTHRIFALALSALAIVEAAIVYTDLTATRGLAIPQQASMLVGIAIAASIAGVFARRQSEDAETAFMCLGLTALGRLAFLGFTQTELLPWSFAVTASLISASVAALALGFWRELPSLRRFALAGLGIATLKSVLIDLSTAGPFVRVGLLLALGVGLLAGGYWYVKRTPRAAPPPSN